jgi:hypothetical protein
MHRQKLKRAIPCVLVLCFVSALAVGARTSQGGLPSFIRAEHREVVQNFLKLKSYLRVATFADVKNKDGLATIDNSYSESKSPYYAVGDFNRDGREDFAIALVNTRKPEGFAVAVFNGPFRAGKGSVPAYYDETKFGTDDFLIALVDGKNNQLQIGIASDMHTVLLKPRGKRYYVWEGASQ